MTPDDRAGRTPGDRDGHPRDDLAAYAVDALEGREHRAVESHLALCPECRRELAAHEEALAGMIGDDRPPAELWDRISRATGGAARRSRPAGRSARTPGRRALVAAVAGVAAALVVAAGIGVQVWDGGDGGGPPSTAVAAADLPVGRISAADGTVVAVVGADERGSYVEVLPPMDTLPDDRTWQFWSLDGAEPESLGLLGSGEARRVRMALPDGTTSVAISDEPAGGSPAPTGLIAGSGDLTRPA